MEHEIEAIGAASAGSVVTEHHPVTSGEPCRNCGTVVEDRFCSSCGQLASNFHRPFWSLISDGLSDTLSFDGRLARTVPALLLFPGRMTRNYLEGQRTRYVPPFRLFLIASIICFFSFFAASDNMGWFDDIQIGPQPGEEVVLVTENGELNLLTLKPESEIEATLADTSLTDEDRAEWERHRDKRIATKDSPRLLLMDGSVNREALNEYISTLSDAEMSEAQQASAEREFNRMSRIYENLGRSGLTFRQWLPRIAFLFAPIFALFLGLAYIWRRKFYAYDHLIVSMHYQAFLFVWSVVLLCVGLFMSFLPDWVILSLMLVPVIYLYRLLREVYQRGRFTTGLRVFVLLLVTPLILVALISALTSIVYFSA